MRVVEHFGPTIQGEGPYAGRACHFLRLGGCDYRCSWCDTMYAVDPALVRQAPELEPAEVAQLLSELAPAPMLVLSGGNPALWRLDALLDLVRPSYRIISVETQGSFWRPWLGRADLLVISPKPPSSGMVTEFNLNRFERFMAKARICHELGTLALALKVVVFDDDDLAYALAVHERYPRIAFYLSVGTNPEDELAELGARYGWLCERVAGTPALHAATVLPQLHVIAWGHRVGV